MLSLKKFEMIRDTLKGIKSTFAEMINCDNIMSPQVQNFIDREILKAMRDTFKQIKKDEKFFFKRYRKLTRKVRKPLTDEEIKQEIERLELELYGNEETEQEEQPNPIESVENAETGSNDVLIVADDTEVSAEENAVKDGEKDDN